VVLGGAKRSVIGARRSRRRRPPPQIRSKCLRRAVLLAPRLRPGTTGSPDAASVGSPRLATPAARCRRTPPPLAAANLSSAHRQCWAVTRNSRASGTPGVLSSDIEGCGAMTGADEGRGRSAVGQLSALSSVFRQRRPTRRPRADADIKPMPVRRDHRVGCAENPRQHDTSTRPHAVRELGCEHPQRIARMLATISRMRACDSGVRARRTSHRRRAAAFARLYDALGSMSVSTRPAPSRDAAAARIDPHP
jgi:hypothetical protein